MYIHTWQFIIDKFSASVPVILLYVLQSKGSSPGRQGFSMAVAADNSICGSIGGGIMEHKFVEMAKTFLTQQPAAAAIYKQEHDKEPGKNKSGMICSGEQTIFLYAVQQPDMDHIHLLLLSLQKNENGMLLLTKEGIHFSTDIPGKDFLFEQKTETDFLLIEKTGPKNRLLIIGGGHCALALSKLMSSIDFYIQVYEERDGLNTMEQNSFAQEKLIVHSYADLLHLVASGKNVYVVIMTVGFRTDDIALRALMHKNFKYIGVLGSKNKMEKMLSVYRAEKMEESILVRIKTPAGIAIKSQTPQEIAVSIAAEIIAIKNLHQ